MAFDSLSEKLQNVFKNLRSKGRLTEDDVKAALKEVKMALLEADVNFKVVKQFVKDVQERAIGQDVMNGLNPGQMVIKIVNEEMVKLMGAYAELEKQGVKGDNAAQIEADLRRNADTTAAAFENLLDALYSAEAMDISTDIEVLDSILKSQNLTK